MIKTAISRLENFEKVAYGNSFLAQKLLCEYKSLKDINLNNFYTMENCAFMLMGENLSLRGEADEKDIDEIMSFCRFMGVYGLESEIDNLPISDRQIMYLMRRTHTPDIAVDCKNIHNVIINENLYGFSQFCCENFAGASFDTVYSYFARKVNRGISNVHYMRDNAGISSGALVTDYGKSLYLTFVSTRQDIRKQGLATELINNIISAQRDKDLILMCERELIPFYKKLDFQIDKEIFLYTLRKEKI